MADSIKKIMWVLLFSVLGILWFGGWHGWHTYTVWQDVTARVPGPIGDNTVMLWNLGWVKYALDHGSPGFWFSNAYYPEGFLFLYGTHTWLDGLLGWLVATWMPVGWHGSILWANISMLLSTVCTGLLVMWGLRAWRVDHWAVQLLVASAVTFSWFRMFALSGHYHFYGTQWMLASLALVSWYVRMRSDERGRSARFCLIGGGLMLGLTFLNDQTHAVFAAILGLGIVLCCGAKTVWQRIGMSLVFVVLALFVASIHLVPLANYYFSGQLALRVDTVSPRLVDASSLLLPPDRHLLGSMVSVIRDQYSLTWAEGTYLGLVPLILLGMCIVISIRCFIKSAGERSEIITISTMLSLVFIVLAMGDSFRLGSSSIFPLPGAILKKIPVISGIRLPQRWIWPAHLCLALAAGNVLMLWMERGGIRWKSIVLVLLACLPPLEGQSYPRAKDVDYRNDYFMSMPQLSAAVKDRYKSGGVMGMPVSEDYLHGISYGNILQFQWGYDIPITMAYTARMPFRPADLPWKWNEWNEEAGEWLRRKNVTIIYFPMHDGMDDEFAEWIRQAKAAVPGLIVLNHNGEEI